ncbi:MAG: type II toxin-antitoxin system HicB family antitoxin [Candidatus Latescibacterota bacterium]|jgi:predicted RNase H-like HicB family nuclease
MLTAYIQAAMEQARYELIEDEEPYYGQVPELERVWATGRTLESCRQNLAETVEGWMLLSIARGIPVPPLGEVTIRIPQGAGVECPACSSVP